MEFGREVFGVPGNVTQPVSFAPNQLIKQGAKLVTCAEDVIEELPTPVRAALVQVMQPETGEANLLVAASLNPSEKKIYDLLQSDEPQPIDDIVERSGLNSSEVLATLFNLAMKGLSGSCRENYSARFFCSRRVAAQAGLTTLVYKVARRTQPALGPFPQKIPG